MHALLGAFVQFADSCWAQGSRMQNSRTGVLGFKTSRMATDDTGPLLSQPMGMNEPWLDISYKDVLITIFVGVLNYYTIVQAG